MHSSRPVQRSRLNPDDLDRELDILAQLMDTMFRVPGLGWRFGLDPIILVFDKMQKSTPTR